MEKFESLLNAAAIALIVPLFLCPIVYPAAKILLPEGCIILTPTIRISATALIAAVDYALTGVFLIKECPDWFKKKKWPHFITGYLTFLWCGFVGFLWYLIIV